MRRGAKPTKAKVNAKPSVARKSSKDEGSRVRDLEKRLAESLEREKATGEILQEKTRALTQSHARTIDERLGTIHGDERKVKQVLLNLLSNALKFAPGGGPD